VFLECGALTVAAFRWKLFLPEQTFATIFRFTLVGQFYALVLPGQLSGDLMKTVRFLYGRSDDIGRVTSSVIVDKINGFLGVVVLLIGGLMFSTNTLGKAYMIPALIFATVLVGILYIGLNNEAQRWIIRLMPWIHVRVPRIRPVLNQLENAVHAYAIFVRDVRMFGSNLLLAFLFQIVSIFITMVCAHALGVLVPFADWCWIFGVVSLAVALPVTIAGIGVREGLFVYFLIGLGVAYDVALALSLSILAVQLLTALIGGACELWSLYSVNHRQINT
jgi:uncharacterized protein (TIRG00374 family)